MSASLGATLIAALVVQTLPRAVPETLSAAPELTSGGKFAARIVSPRALDGLDTMPLPHVRSAIVDQPPAIPPAFLTAPSVDPFPVGAASAQPAADGSGTRERKVSRGARGPSRAEARRNRTPLDAPVTTDAHDATAPSAVRSASPDDGLLHRVVTKTGLFWSGTSATTREAWSATASVGSSLVSHLLP